MVARDVNTARKYYPEDNDKKGSKKRARIKSKKIVTRQRMVLISVIFASFILAVSTLYGYAKITKMKLEISELESQRLDLENKKEYMLINLEEIKTTSNIEEKAVMKLGMDYPKDDQLVFLDLHRDDSKKDLVENKNKTSILNAIVNHISGLF